MEFYSSTEEEVEEEEEEEDPQLRTNRDKLFYPYKNLVGNYFITSKAPGTIKNYKGAVERLRIWAEKVGVCYLPLEIDDCIVYLIYLSETAESYAAVKTAKYAIAWAHQCVKSESPTDDPSVDLILEAARRKWAHPVKKARPMTVAIIKMLVDTFLGKDVHRSPGHFQVSVVHWRTVINVVVKFCFIARNADVLELTRQHFTFVKDLLYVHFPTSKNDQYFEGNTTMFEARGKVYCPVFLTYKYFQRLGYKANSKGYFLPKVANKKVGRRFGKNIYVQAAVPSQHVSYDTCLKDRRRLLGELGLPAKEFTEHSDRSGGISQIVNAGAPLEDAQTHGRWKSLETAKKYIKKSELKKRKLSRFFFGKD